MTSGETVYLLTEWHHEPVSPTYVHATQSGALAHAHEMWGTTLRGWIEKRQGRWEHEVTEQRGYGLGVAEMIVVVEECKVQP